MDKTSIKMRIRMITTTIMNKKLRSKMKNKIPNYKIVGRRETKSEAVFKKPIRKLLFFLNHFLFQHNQTPTVKKKKSLIIIYFLYSNYFIREFNPLSF